MNGAPPGTVLLCYTVIYGLMRFILEFLRGDPERPLRYGLSEAQWTTMALTAITLGMSMIGWLPLYNWHLWTMAVLLIAAACIIFYFSKNERFRLFTPPHVRQLAEGLHKVEKANTHIHNSYKEPMNMYATGQGLCLSCGKYVNDDTEIDHYTVSIKNDAGIRQASIKKIARLIGALKKHPGRVDLIDRQNGVYHILFTK